MFEKWKKQAARNRKKMTQPKKEDQKKTTEFTGDIEALEPRIMLSATWVDVDADSDLEDAVEHSGRFG